MANSLLLCSKAFTSRSQGRNQLFYIRYCLLLFVRQLYWDQIIRGRGQRCAQNLVQSQVEWQHRIEFQGMSGVHRLQGLIEDSWCGRKFCQHYWLQPLRTDGLTSRQWNCQMQWWCCYEFVGWPNFWCLLHQRPFWRWTLAWILHDKRWKPYLIRHAWPKLQEMSAIVQILICASKELYLPLQSRRVCADLSSWEQCSLMS